MKHSIVNIVIFVIPSLIFHVHKHARNTSVNFQSSFPSFSRRWRHSVAQSNKKRWWQGHSYVTPHDPFKPLKILTLIALIWVLRGLKSNVRSVKAKSYVFAKQSLRPRHDCQQCCSMRNSACLTSPANIDVILQVSQTTTERLKLSERKRSLYGCSCEHCCEQPCFAKYKHLICYDEESGVPAGQSHTCRMSLWSLA